MTFRYDFITRNSSGVIGFILDFLMAEPELNCIPPSASISPPSRKLSCISSYLCAALTLSGQRNINDTGYSSSPTTSVNSQKKYFIFSAKAVRSASRKLCRPVHRIKSLLTTQAAPPNPSGLFELLHVKAILNSINSFLSNAISAA